MPSLEVEVGRGPVGVALRNGRGKGRWLRKESRLIVARSWLLLLAVVVLWYEGGQVLSVGGG